MVLSIENVVVVFGGCDRALITPVVRGRSRVDEHIGICAVAELVEIRIGFGSFVLRIAMTGQRRRMRHPTECAGRNGDPENC